MLISAFDLPAANKHGAELSFMSTHELELNPGAQIIIPISDSSLERRLQCFE